MVIVAFIIAVAFKRGNWLEWVGFRGKTVWNWLELLGVPLSLAILGYILQQQQRERDRILAREQREIAADEEKEEILQTYFDRLSTLLIDKNLLAIATTINESEKSEDVNLEQRELVNAAIDVVRARTLSILRRLADDPQRKAIVIGFLIEASVIKKTNIEFSGADLRNVDFSETSILFNSKLNLGEANLSGADFSNSLSSGGNNFTGANLKGANFTGALLMGASLHCADLSVANLDDADLSYVRLDEANLDSIHWNDATQWPDAESVANANNIPEKLKVKLGIE